MSDPLLFSDDFDIDVSSLPVKPIPVGETRKLMRHLEHDDYVLPMDMSSLESWLACPRKAFWALIHSRGGYKSAALTFGSAIHKGLEAWYKGNDARLCLMDAEAELMKNPPDVGEWRDFNCLRNALEKYFDKYRIEPFEVIPDRVEVPFELPLGVIKIERNVPNKGLLVKGFDGEGPFYIRNLYIQWTGKIDLLVEQNGDFWNLDHKTTSIGGPSYFDQFTLSQQFIGYNWAARELDNKPYRGTILNLLINRKRSEKGQGKPLELERRYYPYTDFNRQSWRQDIMSHIENLVHATISESFPMNSCQCQGKYGTCAYHRVCTMPSEKEQFDMAYSDVYIRNVWNPLTEE